MFRLDMTNFETVAIGAVMVVAILGLAYAYFLRVQILRKDIGTSRMQEVWNAIREGADAYLNTQRRSILPLIALLTVALFFSAWIVQPTPEAREMFGDNARIAVAFGRAGAFVMGAFFSMMVGRWGMRMAVQGNIRVASASRRSYGEALQVAYRTGTITGMLTDGLGLFGGTLIFILFGKAAPDALLGFGFGGTLIALFMRVGGGIFTKAADVGADLVGKVEAGLEEDDPRNAAVIADLVGDNVGDCAGMAADIFESYEVTIVSALILGLAVMRESLQTTGIENLQWIVFPLVVRAIGVFSSIIGTYFVRSIGKEANAMRSIFRGFLTSAAISVIGFAILTAVYMKNPNTDYTTIDWRPFATCFIGVALAIVIDRVTEYFTSTHNAPVKEIAKSTQFGHATTILSGLAVGYESSVAAILVIGAAILASVLVYAGESFTFILYGVAMTGIGMLTLTGNNVSMDTFGPISDNANGIGEVAELEEKARNVMTNLDAVGNTTKAITKGIAIGSAVIAAVSLFGSFITDTRLVDPDALTNGIRVDQPLVFIGMLIGGAIPVLFGALMIKAVARAAGGMIAEVRRQFRIPGLMEGKVKPDYARAVAISTQAAQRELLPLGIIAVLSPIVVGLILKEEALGGFLAGLILSGQLLAVFMANAGGAWDNAKKYIEDGNLGGKRSPAHAASVTGDTVGDPMKDTAGPALNPMIKVINLVAVILAPIVVGLKGGATNIIVWVVGLVLLAAIVWAVWRSRSAADYGVDASEINTAVSAQTSAAKKPAPPRQQQRRK
ncbi:MAG: sodium-translocating pyrophosphatase [Caldilineales bacterium]|nr:sodium-translocating pyrophosphatase [Caldilineales bacterium]MCW5856847.1 sodium-translocating pyrophosphatase [Caldilineales bacterium]